MLRHGLHRRGLGMTSTCTQQGAGNKKEQIEYRCEGCVKLSLLYLHQSGASICNSDNPRCESPFVRIVTADRTARCQTCMCYSRKLDSLNYCISMKLSIP